MHKATNVTHNLLDEESEFEEILVIAMWKLHIGKNLSSLPDFSIIIAAKEGLQAQLEAPCLPIPLGMSTLRMTG